MNKIPRLLEPPKTARGFTLLEILIVLAIIGLLVGLAVNHLSHVKDKADQQIASIWVNATIKTPLMVYKLNERRFPSSDEGLAALIAAPASAHAWSGPYLDPATLPLDPWGEPYQYLSPGRHNPDSYDVWSKGPDRETGTADDIGNWPMSAMAK